MPGEINAATERAIEAAKALCAAILIPFKVAIPLGLGYVGAGTAECSASFRDFWMAPARGGT